ncbi:Sec-independent protein translocase subunit TatA [Myceligenerans indicum]|uniref:Sec-independent protein translocase protein TatA n=1 Tax=Myceligenerans indicum TaxID=2593663 RepID=A0ABS1LTR5_9MICO|nr:Sec-independent protein translocase subunit TatA [Myceligenerans indicum]MBL0888887.1 Sec-independent protein translocase subunit TatA [Myceligenerans indicum]
MGALQPWHWIILIAIILLLFGSTRLPGLAKSVGQSMKIFKRELNDLRNDNDDDKRDDSTKDGSTAPSSGASKGDDAPKA